MADGFLSLKVAFGGLAGWVADHAGGAPGERDGTVSSASESGECDDHEEVPSLKGVCGGIKSAIEDRGGFEHGIDFLVVGALVDESAPAEVVEEGGFR